MTTAPQRQTGMRASRRGGRLARRWRALLEGVDADYRDRLTRGKTLARGGRVHHLSLSPGFATAEVHDGGTTHRATVRMETLEPETWDAVIDALLGELRWTADLMEGDLPPGLVEALQAIDVHLLPRDHRELDGDCDCGDYALPCAHVAAMHHVLADAMDGDPFVLFTLRGRPWPQLVSALRRAWGDTTPVTMARPGPEAPDPELDWFHAEVPLQAMAFQFAPPESMGLAEPGPLPGDDGLERALRPLYDAGRAAALELAMSEGEGEARRRRRPVPAPAVPENPMPKSKPKAKAPEAPADADTDDNGEVSLTERLTDLLAEADEGAKSRDLAESLGITVQDLRSELIELESLGIVYRTGATRGTRWWLG